MGSSELKGVPLPFFAEVTRTSAAQGWQAPFSNSNFAKDEKRIAFQNLAEITEPDMLKIGTVTTKALLMIPAFTKLGGCNFKALDRSDNKALPDKQDPQI